MDELTVGVEEEFHLVEPDSGRTAPVAPEVLRWVTDNGHQCDRVGFHPELLATQVESVTGICTDLAALADSLTEGRRRLGDAARACGAVLVSAGTPMLSGPRTPVTSGARFDVIKDRYAGALDDYQSCGCHVHVGVADRETAVAVVNHVRPWLATLLALSANSPFHEGRDTGYASWRMVLQSRFPGSGVPPWFDSLEDFDQCVARRVACGVSVDPGMTAWLVRPSPNFPTVEFRVADAATTVPETVLQAALARALVATALAGLSAGRAPVRVRDDVAAAALWCAARYGLRGEGVHPVWERRVPVAVLLADLLDHLAPELAARGELAWARDMVGTLLSDGGGAQRQRQAAAGGLASAVRLLAEYTRSYAGLDRRFPG